MSYQENEEDEQGFENVKKFIDILKQEMLSPEILPFQKAIFQQLRDDVRNQYDNIKTYLKPDLDTNIDVSKKQKNFKYLIYHSQTEKIDYLLKQYLRVRRKKIEKYAMHLMKNETFMLRLSQSEQDFLKGYANLKYNYLDETVLKTLKSNFQGLGGMERIIGKQLEQKVTIETGQTKIDFPQPNLNEGCFVHLVSNNHNLRYNLDIPVENVDGDRVIPASETFFTPYKCVKDLVSSGNAILM